MPAQHLLCFDIRYNRRLRTWDLLAAGPEEDWQKAPSWVRDVAIDYCGSRGTKAATVVTSRIVADLLMNDVLPGDRPAPCSVRCFDKDNVKQWERTYPRNADPRKSKG